MVKEKRSKSKIAAVIILVISVLVIIASIVSVFICNFRVVEQEKEFYERMPIGTKCLDCFSCVGCNVLFRILSLVACVTSFVGIVFSAIAVKIKSKKAKIILVFNIIMLIIGAFFFVL